MSNNKTINLWTERDLTADFKRNRLSPAFEVDEFIHRVADVLAAGKCPIVTGPSGVGKTAIVHELIRRAQTDRQFDRLWKRQVLQISIQRRSVSLPRNQQVGTLFDAFVDAVKQSWRPPVIFIRDVELAYEFDLESALASLAGFTKAPVICEGSAEGISRLIEDNRELQQHFVTVAIDEPDLTRTESILRTWSAQKGDRTFAESGIQEAIALTHRFLGRDRMPRKAIDLLEQTDAHAPRKETIESAQVIDRFCAMHRTPRVLVDPMIPLDMSDLREEYAREIVGQPEAIDAMLEMIGVIKAGLSDIRRPLGVFLLVGGSGVGKTHLAHLVAKHLFGSPEQLVRINMADLGGDADDDLLFGCSYSEDSDRRRGMLTMRLLGHPFGVVLLDEFEKANPTVHDRFFQLIDEGSFINADGEFVPCRSLIFIATSNAGALGSAQPFGFKTNEAFGAAAKCELERSFRFELLNRFDRIIQFQTLDQTAIRAIARMEVDKLGQRFGLLRRKIELTTDDAVIDWIVARGFDTEQGARAIRRAVERWLTTALARVLVESPSAEAMRIGLTLQNDTPVAIVLPNGEATPTTARRSAIKVEKVGAGLFGRKRRTIRTP
ncbi:MAG: ATP-dependent Clp protease ATP-binding subunit [Planctomycetes bacterium]|nr:ATP-dependent Clp protease ATP-binding subunit [Planctomycetota bacterium]